MKVTAKYESGEIKEGERLTLWGVIFESDGKNLVADVKDKEAAAMKKAGRVK